MTCINPFTPKSDHFQILLQPQQNYYITNYEKRGLFRWQIIIIPILHVYNSHWRVGKMYFLNLAVNTPIHRWMYLSYEWAMKRKFFMLCGVMFLVRLQEEFEIEHSWEWKDKSHCVGVHATPQKSLGPNIVSIKIHSLNRQHGDYSLVTSHFKPNELEKFFIVPATASNLWRRCSGLTRLAYSQKRFVFARVNRSESNNTRIWSVFGHTLITGLLGVKD